MRRPPISRSLVVLLALLALAASLALAACAGSTAGPLSRTASGSGGVTSQEALPPVPAALPGTVGDGSGTAAGGAGTTSAGSPTDVGSVTGPLIVRTGTLDLQVAGVDSAVADATRVVTAAGGYVAGSESSFTGDQPIATLTLRIPAAAWDATLVQLRVLALKVLGEKTSASEVTAQVMDMDARLKNLRATETQLLGVMAQAVKIPDILAVQSELTTVQGEIEQLQAQRNDVADQAAQGTLAVSFGLAPAPVTTVTNSWDPGTVAADAAASLLGMGQGLASAGIWLAIVGLPILLVGLVVLVPILLVVRRVARRGPGATPTASGPSPEAGAAA